MFAITEKNNFPDHKVGCASEEKECRPIMASLQLVQSTSKSRKIADPYYSYYDYYVYEPVKFH